MGMVGRADIVAGVQHGDEGKGKIVDMLLANLLSLAGLTGGYQIVARFNGGENAGHQLYFGKLKMFAHLLPSGVFHPNVQLYSGSGCLINLDSMLGETNEAKGMGFDVLDRLHISQNATIVLPSHIEQDILTSGGVGTTNKGMGPGYAGRATRFGKLDGERFLKNLTMGQVFANPDLIEKTVRADHALFLQQFAGAEEVHAKRGISLDQSIEKMYSAFEELKHCIVSNSWLTRRVMNGSNVLFELAQATRLDVADGDKPYVTGNHSTPDYAFIGGDLSSRFRGVVLGVAKAIPSRAGSGPLVGELGGERSEKYCAESKDSKPVNSKDREAELYDHRLDELFASADPFYHGIALRRKGDEYGTTTGRPRRLRNLNTAEIKAECYRYGIDTLAVTKVDCLDDYAKTPIGKIPVAVSLTLDGKSITEVPCLEEEHRRVEPVYEYLDCIPNISGIRHADDLPSEVIDFNKKLQTEIGVPIFGNGTGKDRDDFVVLENRLN